MSARVSPCGIRGWWVWSVWRQPRLPRTAWLLETGAILAALGTFTALGREYAAPPLAAVDATGLALTSELRTPALDTVVNAVTNLGSEWLWLIWPPIVLLLVVWRRLPSALALTSVALGVHIWNDLLKALFQRARPTALADVLGPQAFSFPSGHAMAAGAVYGFLGLLAWRELRGAPRWLAVAACATLAVAVALSRVYLGVHYPTDVLAGLIAGALWADLVVLGWRLGATGRRRLSHRGAGQPP